jgi:hypothetical protein
MLHVWKLIMTLHRRKKHILWLIVCAIFLFLCSPIINSISLWEWTIVNNAFQHQITEIIWLLFLLYFWSTTLSQLNHTKVTQLLRSKKREPISFISQIRWSIYSVFIWYIIITIIGVSIMNFHQIDIIPYINLLISWWIILTIVMILSLLTNSYAAMVVSLIIYSISYSINFIIFSTPLSFQQTLSYKILMFVQYLFPRFDLLYSTSRWFERFWSIGWNILYFCCIYCIFIYIFLRRYQ